MLDYWGAIDQRDRTNATSRGGGVVLAQFLPEFTINGQIQAQINLTIPSHFGMQER